MGRERDRPPRSRHVDRSPEAAEAISRSDRDPAEDLPLAPPEVGGDPPCWDGLVEDHRDLLPP